MNMRGPIWNLCLVGLWACHPSGEPTDNPPDARLEDEDFPVHNFGPPPPVGICTPGVRATLGNRPMATLDDALYLSQPGDTVGVCPGIHLGFHASLHDGPLRVIGLGADPSNTVLDGELVRPVLYLGQGDAKAVVENLTVRDIGEDPLYGGGGITIGSFGTNGDGYILLREVVFTGGLGPNIYGLQSGTINVLIEDCEFRDIIDGVGVKISPNMFHDTKTIVRRTRFERNLGAFRYAGTDLGPAATSTIIFDDVDVLDNGGMGGLQVSEYKELRVAVRNGRFIGNDESSLLIQRRQGSASFLAVLDDLIFNDNVIQVGAGGAVAAFGPGGPAMGRAPFRVYMRDIDIRRNISYASYMQSTQWPIGEGAVLPDPDVNLTMIRTNFGTGADENLPEDIYMCGHLGLVSYGRVHAEAGMICP